MLSVLLVEDDVRFRELVSAALAGVADMKLFAAVETGGAALEALETTEPHVLLVDLGLPDMSGLDVIRHCAARYPQCEIMVISVFGDEQHILSSIEAGATGYLLKDALPTDLVGQIRTLRAGGSPISPVIARQLLKRRWSETRSDGPPAENLSERERSVLGLVAKGYTFPEIARLLDISAHSVTTYVKRTYRKLHVNSKTEAVYEARKMGLLRD
jgi:DNA-binding NarL/FixJ family response regulator